jgi:hypothetical protein
MSTLWTPDGERPIRRDPPAPAPGPAGPPPSGAGAGYPGGDEDQIDQAQLQAEMAEMQAQLAATPVAAVVANHAVGLLNLAGLHLSLQPPQLDQARLAIDASAALVEGLVGRLGPDEVTLVEGLAQLRLAFVQISAALQPPG